jgi:Zn-dependent M28 family amino/carboxypeptidase
MIFAMRGTPAVAVTSSDFQTASRGYSHTPADTPDILDYELLEHSAYFIADLIRTVG